MLLQSTYIHCCWTWFSLFIYLFIYLLLKLMLVERSRDRSCLFSLKKHLQGIFWEVRIFRASTFSHLLQTFIPYVNCGRETDNKFYAPTGHFPLLILWLPPMVHEEGAEGGTGPLLSGTTTSPPWTLGSPPLISWFPSMFGLRGRAWDLKDKSSIISIIHT